jgi:acylphosphatase
VNAIHLHITGRVQGVFFRASAKEKADTLGITGWVKNCDDGSVEIVAEGEEKALKKFEEWCHKGPTGAEVTHVERVKSTSAKKIKRFIIRSS